MNCPFEKYKYIFGKEKTGIHSYRIYDIAIMDVLMTITGAFIISYLFNYRFIIVLIILFIIGIILHRLFCVNTTINKLIFGKL
jgi:hypothetical protein